MKLRFSLACGFDSVSAMNLELVFGGSATCVLVAWLIGGWAETNAHWIGIAILLTGVSTLVLARSFWIESNGSRSKAR